MSIPKPEDRLSWVHSAKDVEELAKTYVPKVGRPRQKRKYTKRSERWFKD